jgi:hypothetical protein
MNSFQLKCEGFKPPFSNINGLLGTSIRPEELYNAFLLLGLQNAQSFQTLDCHIKRARRYRSLSHLAWFDFGGKSLRMKSGYTSLEQTERAYENYWNGMAFTKIAAQKRLGVPWLQHVSDLEKSGALTINAGEGKSRPDLMGRGFSDNEWHVFEAKGSTRAPGRQRISDAKAQLTVELINGLSPATSSACFTVLKETEISVQLHDPPPEKGHKWEITAKDFFEQYYSLLSNVIKDLGAKTSTIEAIRGVKFKVLVFNRISDYFPFSRLSIGSGFNQIPEWLRLFNHWDLAFQSDFTLIGIGLPVEIIDDPSKAPEVCKQLKVGGPDDSRWFVTPDGVALEVIRSRAP